MCHFIFRYEDGTLLEYEHITEVSYNGHNKLVVVSEEQLADHLFPVGKPLWMRADNKTFSINASNIRSIEVRKE